MRLTTSCTGEHSACADGCVVCKWVLCKCRDASGRLVLGDIITGLNGKPIKLQKDLFGILDDCKVPGRCCSRCRASQSAAAQAGIGSSAGRAHLHWQVATHGS